MTTTVAVLLFLIVLFQGTMQLENGVQYQDAYPDYISQFDYSGNYLRPNVKLDDMDENDLGIGLSENNIDRMSEHTMVTDSNVFPYMATILKGTQYLSSGALVDESWVLTTADGLFLMGDSIRFFRVRLGSINYKKGGVLLPIKMIEIHPYFDDKRPNFDLALLMLATPVRYTPSLRAIKVLMNPRETTATHFIVTSWPGPLESKSRNISHLQSIEIIKRHRILTVTHLHPTEPEDCAIELKEIEAPDDAIMCLDPSVKDPCLRDVGAPVVLNNVLWGVVSSWKPEDCEESSGGPIFATLVSAKNVTTWMHAIVHGHKWTPLSTE